MRTIDADAFLEDAIKSKRFVFSMYSDSFELCEECRANLELWLKGKNVPTEQEG